MKTLKDFGIDEEVMADLREEAANWIEALDGNKELIHLDGGSSLLLNYLHDSTMQQIVGESEYDVKQQVEGMKMWIRYFFGVGDE